MPSRLGRRRRTTRATAQATDTESEAELQLEEEDDPTPMGIHHIDVVPEAPVVDIMPSLLAQPDDMSTGVKDSARATQDVSRVTQDVVNTISGMPDTIRRQVDDSNRVLRNEILRSQQTIRSEIRKWIIVAFLVLLLVLPCVVVACICVLGLLYWYFFS
ncbi:hypothetical protein GGR57DRAFT_87574 [Xylariaceae sp. FL1272]|nr:hypothetical protein GGR57DRAFT_87574 [Xylariaceae sp. FL1272]